MTPRNAQPPGSQLTVPAPSRQYVKLCDVLDFQDRELLEAIRSLIPERDPEAYIERKVWEYGMLMLFAQEAGLLEGSAQVLSVGAGNERILFWLANRVDRVVATDIYGTGRFSAQEADVSMLDDPRAHAPYRYPEDRLDVRWMDARQLGFPDSSFDLVFSISSIEHFGSRRDIARAAAEIGRVLKPGGYAVIVTDCLVRLHPLDATPAGFAVRLLTLGRRSPGARPWRRGLLGETFTPRELQSAIVGPSGLELLQPLDRTVSSATWEASAAPILVQAGRSWFTSACLVLTKPRR